MLRVHRCAADIAESTGLIVRNYPVEVFGLCFMDGWFAPMCLKYIAIRYDRAK